MKIAQLTGRQRRIAAGLLLAVSLCSYAQVSEIRTADTELQVEPGPAAPKLVALRAGATKWSNRKPQALIDRARDGNRIIPLLWHFNPAASHSDGRHIVYVYDSTWPRMRLTWEWIARADHGPIEHTIRIQNFGKQEIWIPLQNSLSFDWQLARTRQLTALYVEKGADTPSPEGTHEVAINDGFQWEGRSSTYAHPRPNQSREIIPFVAVRSEDGTGWYVGIEFSGNTHLTLSRTESSLRGTAGLDPKPGPFWTRLAPNGSFETPAIFLGGYAGGFDGGGNILHRWVRNVLGNPATWRDPHYPLLVNNSWGSGTAVDEPLALRMIQDSAELGFEMFHLDAGWFRGVGDWYPDPRKFPHGLAPLADAAHKRGLKFGLWVDWAQAGTGNAPGALNIHDPKVHDWLVSDLPPDWAPEQFKGQTIDIGDPKAAAWAGNEVERMVRDYHLDMLEHDGYLVAQGCTRKDHPHAPPDPAKTSMHKDSGFIFVDSSNSTDVSYHSTRAYYGIQSKLRRENPGILLEACNDGGRMVDFGSAAHADYFSITDTYDPLSNRRAFYDASHVLPPAMLESYVEAWPTPTIGDFRYMLRSGMMGWFTLMLDTTKWSSREHAVAKEEFQLYKDRLRPLIRDANLYHVSPRPDGVQWDGIEYFDPARGTGALYAFRGSTQQESEHRFVLRGLNPRQNYLLTFHDGSADAQTLPGRELMEGGIALKLAGPDSSEIVFIDEAPGGPHRISER
jgi:hypothetical protein